MHRLLIVEDESWIRMGLETTIDWRALDVELLPSAANGEEALERIRSARPDIVLTDIRMPQMSGLELMRRLHEADPEIMLIVISAYGDFRYAQKAIEYGAFSYVLKPIQESALEMEIRRCVQEIESRKSRYGALTGDLSRGSAELRQWLTGILADGRHIADGAEAVRVALVHVGWQDGVQPDAALLRVLRESLYRYIRGMLGERLLAGAEMGEDAAMLLDARDDRLLMQQLSELNVDGPSAHGYFVTLCAGDRTSLASDGFAAWKQVRVAALSKKYISAAGSPSIDRIICRLEELLCTEGAASAISLAERLAEQAAAGHGFGAETGAVALAWLMTVYRRLEPDAAEQFARRFPALIDAAFAPKNIDGLQAFLRETARQWLDGQTSVRAIVAEATDYIERSITDPELSLSVISTALHTNHAYLSHAFKTDTGLSITEYIMRKRVALAAARLAEPSVSLQQVAAEVGYPNLQYFIRVFKKVMHSTPSRYRKALQKQK